MTDPLQATVVCTLFDATEMRGIVQSALEETVALVPLRSPPPEGEFVLELHGPNSKPVVLVGSSAGDPTGDMFPMHLRAVDDVHYGQLLAFACSDSNLPPPPATRWSVDIPRVPSVLRLDTLPEDAPEFLDEVGPATSRSLRVVRENDPLLGRRLAGGKYQIDQLLGEGSAGAVYRARHLALDKLLAIKVLHPRFRADASFAKRFQAEALAASRLDHPNMTRVQDFGEEPDGLLYIVMEFLQGPELRLLLERKVLTRERKLDILSSVLSALSVAGDHGIVHRDIKPENVIIVPSQNDDGEVVDVVKVCDFGLATIKPRQTDGTDVRRVAAAMSFVAGTPEYMSPEQILGMPIDIRADLYSCGVMLFEMLTDQLPFESRSLMAVLHKQLYDPPQRPRDLDPSIDPKLEALTLRAMSKEPNGRPATPREFRQELRSAMRQPRTTMAPARIAPAPTVAPAPVAPVVQATPAQLADRIIDHTQDVVAELSRPSTSRELLSRLEPWVPTLPLLLGQGALAQSMALANVFVRAARAPGDQRAQLEALRDRALATFRSQHAVALFCDSLLSVSRGEAEIAGELLACAGLAAVSPLLAARAAATSEEFHRDIFVNVMRAFGANAADTIAAFLGQVCASSPARVSLIEDLIRALPDVPRPDFLILARELAHHGAPSVRRLVVTRLPEIVGGPARPILRASTRDPDESVRIAALGSLRIIGAVDASVVELARDLLTQDATASVGLCTAVAAALQDVVPEQRGPAIALLKDALRPRSRSIIGLLRATTACRDEPAVIETVAGALITLAGEDGKREVERRVAVSKGELRQRLQSLLR